MGAEQTLTSRNSQENVTSNNALSINDGSAYGLSLQRKVNTVQCNTNVMQRKAYVATKPLDYLSELVASSPLAKYVYEFLKKNALDVVENDGLVSLVNYWEDSNIKAIDSDDSLSFKDAKKTAVHLKAGVARLKASSYQKDAKNYIDMVDVCDTTQGQETCYSPKVNYKIGDPNNDMANRTSHGIWHKHIIFDPPDLSKQSDDGGQEEKFNINEKNDFHGRIEKLTGSKPAGPANIGFMGTEKKMHCDGKLFSEEVLHKNYTQRSEISKDPKQDIRLMESIERNKNSFPKYDLFKSNCQHWVDKVKSDAGL